MRGSHSAHSQETETAAQSDLVGEDERPTAAGRDREPPTLDPDPITLPRDFAEGSRRGRKNATHATLTETKARPAPEPHPTSGTPCSSRDAVTRAGREPPPRELRPEERTGQPWYTRPRSHHDFTPSERSYSAPHQPDHEVEKGFWGLRDLVSGPPRRPVAPAPRSHTALLACDDESYPPQASPAPPRARAAAAVAPSPSAHPSPAHATPVPPAPRLPEEMRAAQGFVQGVQPLRISTPDAWGPPRTHQLPRQGQRPPQIQAVSTPMPAGHGSNPPMPLHVHAVGVSPGVSPGVMSPTPYSQPQQPPPGFYATPGQPIAIPAQPRGAPVALLGLSSASKARFAWFVAGAAFGIAFAFFATGFFNGGRPASPAADPSSTVAQTATPVAAAVAPPPQPAVPMASVPQAMTPADLPNAPAGGEPQSPTASAPRSAAQPAARPRRASLIPSGPKPSSAGQTSVVPRNAGADPGDLLGAGLKP